jgi:hypothetical protein
MAPPAELPCQFDETGPLRAAPLVAPTPTCGVFIGSWQEGSEAQEGSRVTTVTVD